VDNNSVVFKIKNQPFTSIGANSSGLYYNFRFKGHYAEDWKYYPLNESGYNAWYHIDYENPVIPELPIFETSKGDYTEVAVNLEKVLRSTPPENGLMDIEARAQIGVIESLGEGLYLFTGESSDWSAIQTVELRGTSPSTTPEVSTSPAVNQNGIEIYSNSTVSFFSVNTTASEVSFVVSGPTGSMGCTQIIIAKSFMTNSDFKVYVDGNETSYQLEEKETSWALRFTYHHSEHQVTISTSSHGVNSVLPEWVGTAAIILVVIGLAVAGCIIFWVIRKKA
jgi:hypothetical protein